MSGFAGIVALDGAPVDPAGAHAFWRALAFRGPDGMEHESIRDAAFAHARLHTAPESTRECQPLCLNGDIWIVGDVRVDGRSDLVAQLPVRSADLADVPDIELVARAYLAWGEPCVNHLLGDFSFAIWDVRRRRLFAARDHLGVRPFFYAHVGGYIIFSNTLACVRAHPLVSNRLCDGAIADFLLFEVNQDRRATIFADIVRLAPAHSLTATSAGVATAPYWTLPIDEPLFCRRLDDYTERFQSLLLNAVGDRMRGVTPGVFMSGGLDSPTLVATAQALSRQRGDSSSVRAFTWVEDQHDGGRERHYASLAARYLGVPIDYYEPDVEPIDWDWEQRPVMTPEPDSSAWQATVRATYYRRVAQMNRVVLYGEGPDNALYYEWLSYLRFVKSPRRCGQLAVAAWRHVATQRRVPLWGRWLRRQSAADDGGDPVRVGAWLDDDFARRAGVTGQWRSAPAPEAFPRHPLRPRAYASLHSPLWQRLFDVYDPEWTRTAFEMRHPYLDIRLLRFMLRVPAIPWCRHKYLLRRSMRGRLPRAILTRNKTSIPSDAALKVKRRLAAASFAATASLREYVDIRRALAAPLDTPGTIEAMLRVRSLNHWLQTGGVGSN